MNLTPLHGIRVRLERTSDMVGNYCTTQAVIKVDGERVELRCANCGRYRGCLTPEIAKWLLRVLSHYPEAVQEPFILRDQDYANPGFESYYGADTHVLWEAGYREDDIGE
jgi:hypothetical protein